MLSTPVLEASRMTSKSVAAKTLNAYGKTLAVPFPTNGPATLTVLLIVMDRVPRWLVNHIAMMAGFIVQHQSGEQVQPLDQSPLPRQ